MEVILLYKDLKIQSIFGKYSVHFKNSELKFKNEDNVLYIVDKNIFKLYFKNFKHISKILLIDAKENNKSFENSLDTVVPVTFRQHHLLLCSLELRQSLFRDN